MQLVTISAVIMKVITRDVVGWVFARSNADPTPALAQGLVIHADRHQGGITCLSVRLRE